MLHNAVDIIHSSILLSVTNRDPEFLASLSISDINKDTDNGPSASPSKYKLLRVLYSVYQYDLKVVIFRMNTVLH